MRSLAVLALSLLAATSTLAADVCNGDASFCDRKYSNVTYIGTHGSYAVGANNIAANQNKDVTAQLNDGVRALAIQAHNNNGSVDLCHSSCSLLNGGSLQDYLGKVAAWMGNNPNDVVTLVIVNIDNMGVDKFTPIFEATGLDKKSYKPAAATSTISDWPTLGSMISNGTTLVTFIDNQANLETVPYLIDEFTNMWEDAYDVTTQDFGCAVNRTQGQSATQMYMINHFLDSAILGSILYPNKARLNETNAATGTGSIGFHAGNCVSLYGRNPNIILLDFYDAEGGAPFAAAAQLNGVSAPTASVTPFTATATGLSTTPVNAGTGGVPNADITQKPLNAGSSTSVGLATVVLGLLAATII